MLVRVGKELYCRNEVAELRGWMGENGDVKKWGEGAERQTIGQVSSININRGNCLHVKHTMDAGMTP
jgi:hypothetical protein